MSKQKSRVLAEVAVPKPLCFSTTLGVFRVPRTENEVVLALRFVRGGQKRSVDYTDTRKPMPPKKVSAALVKEDTNTSDHQREGRSKRGASQREQDEVIAPTASIPSVWYHHSVVRHMLTDQFEIDSLSHESLQKYRKVMHLQLASDRVAQNDNPLEAPKRYKRVEKKEELAAAVKRHWSSTQCKESEVITSFFYSIKNQDRTFKLRFIETAARH